MNRYALSLLLLALVPAFSGCGADATQAQAAPPPPPPPLVVTSQAETRTIPIEGEFVGRTAARDTVRIMPRVTGLLESATFVEGSVVKEGDTLFQIERATYEIALEAAKARSAQNRAGLVKARRDLGRLQPLLAEQAVSKQEVDAGSATLNEREAAVKGDQAAIAKAELDLEYTTIKAPITGVVGRLETPVGNVVTPAQAIPLTTLSSFDPMYVYFSMPEATYLALRKRHGNTDTGTSNIPVTLVLADGQPFDNTGKIDFVDRAVDATTGTLTLRVAFPNPENYLRPGQFARVRFELDKKNDAVVVPRIALTQLQSQRSVFVVDAENKVQQRPIVVERELDDVAIVGSGLQGGETIVVEGMQKLRPGMAITPKPKTTEGAR